MSEHLHQLVELEGRLSDAFLQLRQQHCLIGMIGCEKERFDVFLALLSDALRQFCWLEKHRRAVIHKVKAEFPFDLEKYTTTR
jgi:hypothetical protein